MRSKRLSIITVGIKLAWYIITVILYIDDNKVYVCTQKQNYKEGQIKFKPEKRKKEHDLLSAPDNTNEYKRFYS